MDFNVSAFSSGNPYSWNNFFDNSFFNGRNQHNPRICYWNNIFCFCGSDSINWICKKQKTKGDFINLKPIQKRLSEIIPETRRKKISIKLDFAGINEDIDEWIGKRIFLAILFFFIGLLIPLSLGQYLGINELSAGLG